MAKKLHITEVSIDNFRTLRHLHAGNLRQINLITGRNNSGKTTLLEALFLALGPGNPELWAHINLLRGLPFVGKNGATIPYLFHLLDTSRPITIKVSTRDYSSYVEPLDREG